MDEKYKDIGSIEDRVMEECGEVIQAICKAKRFGYDTYHPNRPESNNLREIHLELDDLVIILDEYRRYLYDKDQSHNFWKS